MIRTQLYLPESQYEEIKKVAAEQGMTFAAFAREVLEKTMHTVKHQRFQKKRKGAIDVLLASLPKIEQWKTEGGVHDGSVNHDAYLYGRKKFTR